MDYFGINSSEDLPKLKEIFDDSMVNSTPVTGEALLPVDHEIETDIDLSSEEEEDSSSLLVVSETGELVIEAVLPDIEDQEQPSSDEEKEEDKPEE